VVNTSAFTARATADPGFVHLDMLVRAAAEAPPSQLPNVGSWPGGGSRLSR
jgi:hypothetical protein